MRQNGVRALAVWFAVRPWAGVNVDAYSDDLSVPSFASRMKCSKCGSHKHQRPARLGTKQPYIPAQ